ncbi:MAG TPA: hypothetical protein VLE48_03855, partial [Terriglobales bacterium]|nr:hypothetical protein [Terriglobales bacterium]
MRRTKYTIAVELFLAMILLPAAQGQDETPKTVTNQNRSGDLPFSTSIGTDVESVDIGSGGLSVRIPIVSRPGRGMDFNFMLRYDANFLSVGTRKSGSTFYQKWNVEKRNWFTTNGMGWEPN